MLVLQSFFKLNRIPLFLCSFLRFKGVQSLNVSLTSSFKAVDKYAAW